MVNHPVKIFNHSGFYYMADGSVQYLIKADAKRLLIEAGAATILIN
jgi:hypothetical protein